MDRDTNQRLAIGIHHLPLDRAFVARLAGLLVTLGDIDEAPVNATGQWQSLDERSYGIGCRYILHTSRHLIVLDGLIGVVDLEIPRLLLNLAQRIGQCLLLYIDCHLVALCNGNQWQHQQAKQCNGLDTFHRQNCFRIGKSFPLIPKKMKRGTGSRFIFDFLTNTVS